jgi:hypothetical protein
VDIARVGRRTHQHAPVVAPQQHTRAGIARATWAWLTTALRHTRHACSLQNIPNDLAKAPTNLQEVAACGGVLLAQAPNVAVHDPLVRERALGCQRGPAHLPLLPCCVLHGWGACRCFAAAATAAADNGTQSQRDSSSTADAAGRDTP